MSRLLVRCAAIGGRRLEAEAPEFVKRFMSLWPIRRWLVGSCMRHAPDSRCSHTLRSVASGIFHASLDDLTSRVRAVYDGPFVIGEDLMAFSVTSHGVTAEPSAAIRQQEPWSSPPVTEAGLSEAIARWGMNCRVLTP